MPHAHSLMRAHEIPNRPREYVTDIRSGISALYSKGRAHLLAADSNSSQLVNFPFALSAFLALGGGLLTMCCGVIGTSPWLTVTGLILTLVGVGMYGWSLHDE